MLTLLALVVTPAVPPAAPTNQNPAPAHVVIDDEYDRRIEEAGKDVAKLWDVYLWCDAFGKDKEARSTLRRIIKVDPDHKEAREKLGHISYDGKWFTSEKKLERYKKEEEERIAKEQGLVRYKGEWVAEEDIAFLERGLIRDDQGNWVSAEEHEKLQAGWVRQDLVWVAPDEKENIEKGLWKCGDKWLSLDDANRHHANIATWWVIPSDHYVTYTTCDREVALKAIEEMERAYADFSRATGKKPSAPAPVVVLRSVDQYGVFAAGDEAAQRPSTEARGFSSLHYAYFAETWFLGEFPDLQFMGAGVAYWDASTDAGNAFGKHAVRHAAGQSFVEAIDPSTKALKSVKSGEAGGDFVEKFWEEKALRAWFRYGTASYGERYYVDNLVGSGGNPYWAREWSVQNLVSRGGLRNVDQVFEFNLSLDNPSDSERLISEAGLIVAFVLDGKCPPVIEKHGALKQALKEGKGVDKAFKALEKEIAKHDQELRKFAGI